MVHNYRKVYVLWYEDFHYRGSHTHFVGVYSSRKKCLNSYFGVIKFYRSLHCFKTISASKDEFIFSYEDKILGTNTIHLRISETQYNNFISPVI